jgi:hypothetical protein
MSWMKLNFNKSRERKRETHLICGTCKLQKDRNIPLRSKHEMHLKNKDKITYACHFSRSSSPRSPRYQVDVRYRR